MKRVFVTVVFALVFINMGFGLTLESNSFRPIRDVRNDLLADTCNEEIEDAAFWCIKLLDQPSARLPNMKYLYFACDSINYLDEFCEGLISEEVKNTCSQIGQTVMIDPEEVSDFANELCPRFFESIDYEVTDEANELETTVDDIVDSTTTVASDDVDTIINNVDEVENIENEDM